MSSLGLFQEKVPGGGGRKLMFYNAFILSLHYILVRAVSKGSEMPRV